MFLGYRFSRIVQDQGIEAIPGCCPVVVQEVSLHALWGNLLCAFDAGKLFLAESCCESVGYQFWICEGNSGHKHLSSCLPEILVDSCTLTYIHWWEPMKSACSNCTSYYYSLIMATV